MARSVTRYDRYVFAVQRDMNQHSTFHRCFNPDQPGKYNCLAKRSKSATIDAVSHFHPRI